jgi:diguanylate cyclase (GGDEF)-like protein
LLQTFQSLSTFITLASAATIAELRAAKALVGMQNAQLEAANAKLEALSVTDSMTGVMNRRGFQQNLEMELERLEREQRPFSVLLVDADEFKKYNDSFGHPAGDEVLVKLATLLADLARNVDTVARYGGEEFAILAPGADELGAIAIGERLRHSVAQEHWPRRQLTISVGIATLVGRSLCGWELIQEADRALYAAKRGGRNRVMHFNDLPVEGVLASAAG